VRGSYVETLSDDFEVSDGGGGGPPQTAVPTKRIGRSAPGANQHASGAGEGGGTGGFEELRGVGANVAVTEDGVARNEKFGPRFDDIGDSLEIDAAVDFNAKIEFAFGAHADKCGDFVEGIWNEFLAAESGIDAHHEHVVNEVENFGKHFHGSSGIEDDAGLAAVGADEMKRAVKMDAGFLVNGNPVSTGIGEFGDEEIGILDHQVAIEGNRDDFSEPLHDGRANGDVGNEVAIHDVDVEDGAAAVDGQLRFGAELREIGGEDGGGEFDFHEAIVAPVGMSIIRRVRAGAMDWTEASRAV
jgi:hypothetical protein